MNSLYSIIKSIQAAQGSNAKKAILEVNRDHELLQEYLKAVYDPSLSYYQKKVPKHGAPSERQKSFDMLDIEHTEIFSKRFVTGKEAVKCLVRWIENQNSVEDQELCKWIIERSIGAGVGDTMILKVWPNLYFIPPYQRCSLMTPKIKQKFEKLDRIFVQEKFDGSFCYAVIWPNGDKQAITRAGNSYPQWFSDKLLEGDMTSPYAFVGELLVANEATGNYLSRQEGNGILNSILKGGGNASEYTDYSFVLLSWDLLTTEEFQNKESPVSYEERLEHLENILYENHMVNIDSATTYIVKTLPEAMEYNQEFLLEGKEGSVIKNPAALWKDNTSTDMVKLKVVFEADYKIIGFVEGEGKYAGMLGAFQMQTSDGLIDFEVGTGYTDSMRKDFWEQRISLLGVIATVKANDIVTSQGRDTYSLFLPVFSDIRFDKTVADTHEHVKAQLEAARGF